MKKITKYAILGISSSLILTSLTPTLSKVISVFESHVPETLYSAVLSVSKFAPAASVLAATLLMFLIMARNSLMPEMNFLKKIYMLKVELLILVLMSNSYWFAQPILQSEKLSNTASEDKLTGLNVNVHSTKAIEQLSKKIKAEEVDFVFVTSDASFVDKIQKELSSIGYTNVSKSPTSSVQIYSRYILSKVDSPSIQESAAMMEKDNKPYLLIAIDNRGVDALHSRNIVENALVSSSSKAYPVVLGGYLNMAPTDPLFERLHDSFDVSKISYPLVSGNPWLRGVFGDSAAPILGSNNLKFVSHETSNFSGQNYRGELFVLNTN